MSLMQQKVKTIEKVDLQEQQLEQQHGEFTLLNCPSCSEPTPAKNINIHDQVAKCEHCNAVYSFQGQLDTIKEKDHPKQELIRPAGIDMFYFQDELDIAVKQPMTNFEIISWIAVMLVFFVAFISTMLYFDRGEGLIALTISWIITILGSAGLSNGRSKHKVYLSTDNGQLHVHWRPKKFIKDKTYQINEIDQFYVSNAGGTMSLRMIVNSINGQEHVKLLTNLQSVSKAKFLEQELEKYLGIPNKKVPEEMKD